MEMNYLAVLGCGVIAMVLGSIWYGPLFGKKWMWLLNVDPNDSERNKEMQKAAMPLYGIQFLLSLIQAYVLARLVGGVGDDTGLLVALWLWVGFIVPAIAGASMWTNESNDRKWWRFGIQIGYQLVLMLAFAFVLGRWG